ncbi:MAG: excinuclease ABC subunit UvrA [Proteobacteria bacterium]|nr:excinuclease ABC subunit UvrA [Pseudomonadota bacterium]
MPKKSPRPRDPATSLPISPTTHLIIKGASEHNLKHVSLTIPKHTLTVITGVSGSGKSSLAFDTIYAEGQRRYVESLSAYARQFLELNRKPDVERIEGLSPAIAIEQKTTSKNPRSTVGTITEIYDYLRLLFANAGTAHCPNHPNIEITAQTIQQMVDHVLAWPEGSKIIVMAPVVRGRKGEYLKERQQWQAQGYTRAVVDGELIELADNPKLTKNDKHDISLVIDRLVVKPDSAQRLADSLATALKLAEGLAEVATLNPTAPTTHNPQPTTPFQTRLFSEQHSCPLCGHATQLEPRLFSFNSPFGACAECDGLGEVIFFSPELLVPNESLTINQGAIHPWAEKADSRGGLRLNKTGGYYIKALARHYGFSPDTPWHKLPEKIRHILLHGSGSERIEFTFEGGRATYRTRKSYDGVLGILKRRWEESENPYAREDLNRYRAAAPCPTCHGARLNPSALAVTIGEQRTGPRKAVGSVLEQNRGTQRLSGAALPPTNIAYYCSLPITEALSFTEHLQKTLHGAAAQIATPILREIYARLGFLNHVGLGYLSLERTAGTLSGGEAQRIRLASQIGSGLTGVLYVLDEPSIGLHQRDNHRLLETLTKLRDLDNTVLVVEHDEDAIRMADHVIDMGPHAGTHGGEVVAQGSVNNIIAEKRSLTGQYLSGKRAISVPKVRRKAQKGKAITVVGAQGNNLKNLTVEFPIGLLTCVTGVSGSGKSTLVMDTLHNALAARLNGSKEYAAKHTTIEGLEHIDKLVNIDQSPIGRTPRSNPATYTGIYSPIRDWFAQLPESKARGYGPGRFSFNVKGGRCEACEGDGVIKVEMHFLPDVYVPCEVCKGKRFNRETLEVKYKTKSIADILDMTVEEAHTHFAAVPRIARAIKTLIDVGLGYISLGQNATTLSGGEAQRIKLAKELSKIATGRTLYILDEPTTGLHFADIDQLLKVLHRLVDSGNTMIIIEHNLDVIKTADWLIDIGPEGGAAGGQLLAEGTPEQLAKVKASHTGQFLKPLLK